MKDISISFFKKVIMSLLLMHLSSIVVDLATKINKSKTESRLKKIVSKPTNCINKQSKCLYIWHPFRLFFKVIANSLMETAAAIL